MREVDVQILSQLKEKKPIELGDLNQIEQSSLESIHSSQEYLKNYAKTMRTPFNESHDNYNY